MAVELFVSERGDQFLVQRAQNSYYDALLDAGVRIFRYPSPAVLHAKHVSVDDTVAVVGSSNLDVRSFTLNFEVSLLCTGGDVVRRVRDVEDAYRSVSSRADRRAVARTSALVALRRQRHAAHVGGAVSQTAR